MDEETKRIYEKYGIDPKKREKENQKIIKDRITELDRLNKKKIRKIFSEGMKSHFNEVKEYLQFQGIHIFKELEDNVQQVIFSLITESYSASITTTNHILERLLKLALIKNEVGLNPIKFDDWNSVYGATNGINNKDMNETIDLCLKKGLISPEQKQYLTDMRRSLRNGFSHYSPESIFKGRKGTVKMIYHAPNPADNREVEFNFTSIPMLQSAYIGIFARENALAYFDYVYRLIRSIEIKLKAKHHSKDKV